MCDSEDDRDYEPTKEQKFIKQHIKANKHRFPISKDDEPLVRVVMEEEQLYAAQKAWTQTCKKEAKK